MDAVSVVFTFLRNHFSEKSNMDAASAAFGVKCPFTHYFCVTKILSFCVFKNVAFDTLSLKIKMCIESGLVFLLSKTCILTSSESLVVFFKRSRTASVETFGMYLFVFVFKEVPFFSNIGLKK